MKQSLTDAAMVGVRVEMARQGITPAELARRLDVELRVLNRRLYQTVPVTLQWFERICEAIEVEPQKVLPGMERSVA